MATSARRLNRDLLGDGHERALSDGRPWSGTRTAQRSPRRRRCVNEDRQDRRRRRDADNVESRISCHKPGDTHVLPRRCHETYPVITVRALAGAPSWPPLEVICGLNATSTVSPPDGRGRTLRSA